MYRRQTKKLVFFTVKIEQHKEPSIYNNTQYHLSGIFQKLKSPNINIFNNDTTYSLFIAKLKKTHSKTSAFKKTGFMNLYFTHSVFCFSTFTPLDVILIFTDSFLSLVRTMTLSLLTATCASSSSFSSFSEV